jgi:hypothetical protein
MWVEIPTRSLRDPSLRESNFGSALPIKPLMALFLRVVYPHSLKLAVYGLSLCQMEASTSQEGKSNNQEKPHVLHLATAESNELTLLH